jgi:hippurate hydrolase
MNSKLKQYRIDLHQIPELQFDLFKTHEYVKGVLESFGYQTETVAKTGLIAVKKGLSKSAIAFRSDMDALPVTEQTNNPYPSRHLGNMHACGHDGHMAMLLGFAEVVSKIKTLNKTVVFIFQPAEEGPGGAKVIIEAGIFEQYNIEKIFGIHLYPGLTEGKFGLADGPMMAQNGEFNISIKGKSAHGAQPHLGFDAILAAGGLVSQYHTIISRYIDPLDPAVITIGTIHGGEARNIIAHEVKLTGTIRSFNQGIYSILKQKMRDIDSGIEHSYDVTITNDIIDYYPPVINDHALFEQLKNHLNQDAFEILRPMMFAEDFAFYQEKVPGLFVMLGTQNQAKGFIHPLHSCYFDFDESVLVKGVELYQLILEMESAIS